MTSGASCARHRFFLCFLWNWLAPASGFAFLACPLTTPLVVAKRCLRSFFFSLDGLLVVPRLLRQEVAAAQGGLRGDDSAGSTAAGDALQHGKLRRVAGRLPRVPTLPGSLWLAVHRHCGVAPVLHPLHGGRAQAVAAIPALRMCRLGCRKNRRQRLLLLLLRLYLPRSLHHRLPARIKGARAGQSSDGGRSSRQWRRRPEQ